MSILSNVNFCLLNLVYLFQKLVKSGSSKGVRDVTKCSEPKYDNTAATGEGQSVIVIKRNVKLAVKRTRSTDHPVMF